MILNARIPIIKCCNKSGRLCDISFGTTSGLSSVRVVREKVAEYPHLRPILLVLKQYLKSQNLNEPHSGGLSSYALFHMILSLLNTSGSSVVQTDGLGGLLLHFLDFFGRKFDPTTMTVGPTGILDKPSSSRALTILDMMDASKEVAKSASKYQAVLTSFDTALATLTRGACHPPADQYICSYIMLFVQSR